MSTSAKCYRCRRLARWKLLAPAGTSTSIQLHRFSCSYHLVELIGNLTDSIHDYWSGATYLAVAVSQLPRAA